MIPGGFRHLPRFLSFELQEQLARQAADAIEAAGAEAPTTPWGRPMSVRMTNLGPLGWVSDRSGYRYAPRQPGTGAAWPPMPPELLELWAQLGERRAPPDACLVNLYRGAARMGLHQDRDETDFTFPVVSISLGDQAIFRIGGRRRGDPSATVTLASGDVVVLAGAARLAFHGIDRILPGTSALVPGGGRINLTLRRARAAEVL